MKFTAQQKILHEGINKVQRAVSTKTTLPVLSGIYISADKDTGLKLIGTDLDLGISCVIPEKKEKYDGNNLEETSKENKEENKEKENQQEKQVNIKEEGEIVLPATHISNIVRELPDDNILFSLDKENMQIEIKCQNSVFKINGYNPDEFPQLPRVEEPDKIKIKGSNLKQIIREVKLSISQNQSQPALTGALFEIDKEKITMVSTNTYRLACSEYQIKADQYEKNLGISEVIIPGDTLNELSSLLTGQENVEILLDENHICFNFNDTSIISRLIEGQFPNYQQVIPREYNTRINVNTRNLNAAVKRASLIARQDSNEISLSINNNILEINTLESETGEVHEEINILEMEGPEQNIKIDAGYLQDVLKITGKENINLDLIGPVSPLTINTSKEDRKYTYLIMPIRQD